METEKAKPVLTRDGVKSLIDQLDKDLDRVANSTADDAEKRDLAAKISQLKFNLRVAVADAEENITQWVVDQAPQFAVVTPILADLQPRVANGACVYEGGCINSTQAQCEALRGTFVEGQTCSS